MNDELLVLVRHGETQFHAEKRYQGRSPASVLSERGVKQTLELVDCLNNLDISWVFSSPVARAQQTLKYLKPALSGSRSITKDQLKEVEIGKWVGRLKYEIEQNEPNSLSLWRTLPHMFFDEKDKQPLLELYRRSRSFYDELEKFDGNKLIVGHDHLNRSIICTSLDLPMQIHSSIPQAISSISIIGEATQNCESALHVSNLEHEDGETKKLTHSANEKRLYLIRHGVTDANVHRVYQGTNDLALNAVGRSQIEELSELISELRPSLILTSDLERTKGTADLLPFKEVERISDARLNEFQYGRWQGLEAQEVYKRFPDDRMAWRLLSTDTPIPDGESISSLIGRVTSILSSAWEQAGQHGPVVIVAHDVVIRTIIAISLNLHIRKIWAFPMSNAGVTELRKREIGNVELRRHNILAGRLEHRYGCNYL